MFLRGPLLFLVCVIAEMLGIKEIAKQNNTSDVLKKTNQFFDRTFYLI